jgi:hypothetical protein
MRTMLADADDAGGCGRRDADDAMRTGARRRVGALVEKRRRVWSGHVAVATLGFCCAVATQLSVWDIRACSASAPSTTWLCAWHATATRQGNRTSPRNFQVAMETQKTT